jgi:hypothetical protein
MKDLIKMSIAKGDVVDFSNSSKYLKTAIQKIGDSSFKIDELPLHFDTLIAVDHFISDFELQVLKEFDENNNVEYLNNMLNSINITICHFEDALLSSFDRNEILVYLIDKFKILEKKINLYKNANSEFKAIKGRGKEENIAEKYLSFMNRNHPINKIRIMSENDFEIMIEATNYYLKNHSFTNPKFKPLSINLNKDVVAFAFKFLYKTYVNQNIWEFHFFEFMSMLFIKFKLNKTNKSNFKDCTLYNNYSKYDSKYEIFLDKCTELYRIK